MVEWVLIALLLIIITIVVSAKIFRAKPKPFVGRARSAVILFDIVVGGLLLFGCIFFAYAFWHMP